MVRPKKVRILGTWWRVVHTSLRNEEIHGDCDPDHRIIRIEETLDDELFGRVFRHEKFHAKLFISGLSEIFSDEQQEALAVLAENKD